MTCLGANDIIRTLRLEPLVGEGGWYRRTHAGPVMADGRPSWTSILYLLTADETGFSALHRLDAPEMYHFHGGDPVEILLLHPDGRDEVLIMGPDLLAGQQVQALAAAGCWQGSRVRPGGDHALLGTTMTPGYWPAGYEPGRRSELEQQYPARADLIAGLTRE